MESSKNSEQRMFYVTQFGHQRGPFEMKEVSRRIEAGELQPTDYIFDDSVRDWVMLIDFAVLSEVFAKVSKPVGKQRRQSDHMKDDTITMKVGMMAGPAKHQQQIPNSRVAMNSPAAQEWFVLKGDNRFGPFAFLDLVKMLQKKQLHEFDYIWRNGHASWHRVAEMEEFTPEAIRRLKDSADPELSEVFFRRRHARAGYGASLIIHDNMRVWRGQSMEISLGGAGVTIDEPGLQVGQTLYMHFKPGDEVPPFNAVCEVVSKRSYSKSQSKKPDLLVRGTFYGVKFTAIQQQTQEFLDQYTKRKIAA